MGLPQELVDKASSQVKNMLPLLHADTESLIERFKRLITETIGVINQIKVSINCLGPQETGVL